MKIDYGVYLVTDEPSRYRGDWLENVAAAVDGGVTCVQYRDTESAPDVRYARARALKDLLAARHVPLVVNNDAYLAAAVKAEGVHVGQSDMAPRQVREIVGPDCAIGLSVTDRSQIAALADLRGVVDALGIGPVFDATKTKRDAAAAMGTAELAEIVKMTPGWRHVAIGGITTANAAEVFAAGADGVAVVSAFSRADDPAAVARAFRRVAVRPCCLTVAGSDSGGNAGVQADLRAFHAYGLHGCTVFAALTAQNPFGVSAIHAVPPNFVAAQLDAVLGVYAIRAMKTGMLADAAAIEVVADRLAAHPEIACVIDPVMVATSGARLVDAEAVKAIVGRLLPRATLVTPNLPEAEVLCGSALDARAARAADARHAAELARRLGETHGCAVLVKGGHGAGAAAVDVLYAHGETREFSMPWVADPVSTHGTGCSLAAALAAELALGAGLAEAVAGAKRFVHAAIAGSYPVGPGCGVLALPRNMV